MEGYTACATGVLRYRRDDFDECRAIVRGGQYLSDDEGALVLFVGLFSVIFLRRKLYLYQWSALFIVVLGVGIVGLAGAIAPNPQAKPDPKSVVKPVLLLRAAGEHVKTTVQTPEAMQTIIGVLLIAGAQIFTATQFVLEEYILEQYALEPLKVVGWKVFSVSPSPFGMLILHLAIGRTEKGDTDISTREKD
jgi:drug/metabolite transporter (DMT)-like permease